MVIITIQGKEDFQRRRRIDELFSSLTVALYQQRKSCVKERSRWIAWV